ncbi:hypothetical protein [uncultured Tateyamaria sp.]|uniref:hypothetical protein n=1 Tax=uncultured Tateyamaria sp. TaxID=455651 RepID=UPI0026191C4E|nr:hypothetical protein [uncultured Tateyamaria sp.]
MTGTVEQETKRGRVRRLFIDPLKEGGMRSPSRTDAGAERSFLDRVCDELARLSDDELMAMRRWAETNGDGSAKRFWPAFVAIAGIAQTLHPRPLEELPELASWFGSRKGPALSHSSGLLVAHFRYIQIHRHPPTRPDVEKAVEKRAAELQAEWLRAIELRERGRPYDEPFFAAYERDLARAQKLVDAGVHKRTEGGAV